MTIEAHQERERQSTIGRVIAICKALGKGDPLEGLREAGRTLKGGISRASATKRWLFGSSGDDDGGNET